MPRRSSLLPALTVVASLVAGHALASVDHRGMQHREVRAAKPKSRVRLNFAIESPRPAYSPRLWYKLPKSKKWRWTALRFEGGQHYAVLVTPKAGTILYYATATDIDGNGPFQWGDAKNPVRMAVSKNAPAVPDDRLREAARKPLAPGEKTTFLRKNIAFVRIEGVEHIAAKGFKPETLASTLHDQLIDALINTGAAQVFDAVPTIASTGEDAPEEGGAEAQPASGTKSKSTDDDPPAKDEDDGAKALPKNLPPSQGYLALSITELTQKQKAGSGFSFAGFGVTKTPVEARIVIALRWLDPATGKIVDSSTIKEVVEKEGVKIASEEDAAFDYKNDAFAASPLAEAMDRAIRKVTRAVVDKLATLPFEARVLYVDDGKIFVNAGALAGLRAGDRFHLVRPGTPLVDPGTGAKLGTANDKEIGVLEIAEAKDKFSRATLIGGKAEAAKGDRLR